MPQPIFQRVVTHDQAANAAKNFIDAHFKNTDGKGILTSIPAQPYDDDLLLTDYIKQRRNAEKAAFNAGCLAERERCAAVAKTGWVSADYNLVEIADADAGRI